jgi:hypothetical protein
MGAITVSAVSALGRSFDVVDGVVDCTEEEAVEIAQDLAPHGFVLTAIEVPEPPAETEEEAVETEDPVPEAITDLDPQPAAPAKKPGRK